MGTRLVRPGLLAGSETSKGRLSSRISNSTCLFKSVQVEAYQGHEVQPCGLFLWEGAVAVQSNPKLPCRFGRLGHTSGLPAVPVTRRCRFSLESSCRK